MKFAPKCRTKNLGMLNTILERFCSFLNWEGAIIRPQIRPRKIPGYDKLRCRDNLSGQHSYLTHYKLLYYIFLIYGDHNGLCYLCNIKSQIHA